MTHPVIGDALRTVGYRRRTRGNPKHLRQKLRIGALFLCVMQRRYSARSVANVGDRPSDTLSPYRVTRNDVVVGIGRRAVDLGIGFGPVSGARVKTAKGSLIVGHKETVSASDVFFSVNVPGYP